MGILDQLASGGKTSALDVVKSRTRGQKDALTMQNTRQTLQLQALKMEEWMSNRESRRIKNDFETAQASQGLDLIGIDTSIKKKKQQSTLKGMVDKAEQDKVDYLSRVIGDASENTWPEIYADIPEELKEEFNISPSYKNNQKLKEIVINRTINTAEHRRKKELQMIKNAAKVDKYKDTRKLSKKEYRDSVYLQLKAQPAMAKLDDGSLLGLSSAIVDRANKLMDIDKKISWDEAKEKAMISIKGEAINPPIPAKEATLNPLTWFDGGEDATIKEDWKNPVTAAKAAGVPQEIKRKTKDGRVAIYDSSTKKFLRYE